jgi:hypothetical protein
LSLCRVGSGVSLDDVTEPDDLEKIARKAVERGYMEDRAAREAVAMTRVHIQQTPVQDGGRLFFRKLLERTCGLTYDELARLEKEALAPPVAATPGKPLPSIGTGRPASEASNQALGAPRSHETLTPKPLPRLRPSSSPSQPAVISSEPVNMTPSKAIPRLRPASSPTHDTITSEPLASKGLIIPPRETEVVQKAKLPKLEGSKSEDPPPPAEPKQEISTRKLPRLGT